MERATALITGGDVNVSDSHFVTGGLDFRSGGTIYAAAVDDQGGTIEQNGGALIVPEAGASTACLAALAALVALNGKQRFDLRQRVRRNHHA